MMKVYSLQKKLMWCLCWLPLLTFAQTFTGSGGTVKGCGITNDPSVFELDVTGVASNAALYQVTINVDYYWISDINVYLIAPDGQQIELTTGNGGSGDDYINTRFRDDATFSIITSSSSAAPFNGVYRPEQPLSTFAGQTNGLWKLKVCNWYSNFSLSAGTAGEWKLEFVSPPENDLCANAIALNCGDSVSGSNLVATTTGNQSCNGFNFSNGVWYSIVGNGGKIELDASNADFDAYVAVYSGTCDALSCVGFASDSYLLASEEGAPYYVFVGGSTFGKKSGTFQLDVNCICEVSLGDKSCLSVYPDYDKASTVTLEAEGSFGVPPYTYEWSTGESGEYIYVSPTETTVYTVTLHDAVGCSSTAEITVLALPAPDLQSISCARNKVTICHIDDEGNRFEICVSENSLQGHLSHGDVLGSCDSGAISCYTPPACDIALETPAATVDVDKNTDLAWTAASGLVEGYYVTVGTTAGGNDVVNNVDVGNVLSYNLPALNYETTYYVSIVPYNVNGSAADCTSFSFTTESLPSTVVSCGEPYQETFCYGNNEDRVWVFSSSDGGPLKLQFSSGWIESFSFDKLRIYDGFDASGTLLYQNSSSGTITANVIANSGYIFMTLTSDGSVSCSSSPSTRTWNFNVSCYTPPPGISAANAELVTCGSTTLGTTIGYPVQNVSYCNTTLTTAPGRWYKLQGTGFQIDVSTCGSSFDTKLGVFSGTPSSLTCVGGNDDAGTAFCSSSTRSRVTFNSVLGVTYYIYVTGYSTNKGATSLTVTCGAPFRTAGESKDLDAIPLEDSSSWTLYPNPARDRVSLNLSRYLNTNVTVRVIDYTGKIIMTRDLTNLKVSDYTLELNANLPDGMYIVQLATPEGISANKLVIMK